MYGNSLRLAFSPPIIKGVLVSAQEINVPFDE